MRRHGESARQCGNRDPRSYAPIPKRHGTTIPPDGDLPKTPPSGSIGGWRPRRKTAAMT